MALCPCCGKIFDSERGASIHMHYCPKRADSGVHSKEQDRQIRKEIKEVFNNKVRWKMKQLNVSTKNSFSKTLH